MNLNLWSVPSLCPVKGSEVGIAPVAKDTGRPSVAEPSITTLISAGATSHDVIKTFVDHGGCDVGLISANTIYASVD